LENIEAKPAIAEAVAYFSGSFTFFGKSLPPRSLFNSWANEWFTNVFSVFVLKLKLFSFGFQSVVFQNLTQMPFQVFLK